jgi:hypothetical protein
VLTVTSRLQLSLGCFEIYNDTVRDLLDEVASRDKPVKCTLGHVFCAHPATVCRCIIASLIGDADVTRSAATPVVVGGGYCDRQLKRACRSRQRVRFKAGTCSGARSCVQRGQGAVAAGHRAKEAGCRCHTLQLALQPQSLRRQARAVTTRHHSRHRERRELC